MQTASTLPPNKDDSAKISRGKWHLWTTTDNRSPTDMEADVYIILCGLKKDSKPIRLQDVLEEQTEKKSLGETYSKNDKMKPFSPGIINYFKV